MERHIPQSRFIYEWDIQECSQEEDGSWSCVEDHNESEVLSWFMPDTLAKIDQKQFQLVLVQLRLNKDGEITSRDWAYCEFNAEGQLVLNENFEYGKKVPKKFHQELARRKIVKVNA